MLFNVTKAANLIMDETKNRYFRAIKLFELHMAIRFADGCPETKNTAEASDNSPSAILVRVPTSNMHDARMFAVLVFLEYVENKISAEKGTASAQTLARDPDWTKLFNKKFIPLGGFRRVRNLPKARDFDADLREAMWRAKQASRLIDFSLRFEPDPKRPKLIGGVTMAKTIVLESKYYNVKCAERKLHDHWKSFEPVAGFLPMIAPNRRLKRTPQVTPLPTMKQTVAEKLLERLDDREALTRFFSEYNANVARLKARGYHLQSLSGQPVADIAFEPLPEEVIDLIDAYRS
ncbi:MAG TPA: hypothetical protein VIE66_18685 [Methylocella sp.]|jgi:hypothetical protein